METKPSIEEQVNAALNSVKKIEQTELPYGFTDRVLRKVHTRENNIRPLFVFSQLVKVAAIIVLVLVNVFTLRLTINQPGPAPSQYATIKDFVNVYQINDSNEELLTTNTPAHE